MVLTIKTTDESYQEALRITERRRRHEKLINNLNLTKEEYVLLAERVHEERGKE